MRLITNKWWNWLINSQWWSKNRETTPQADNPQYIWHQPLSRSVYLFPICTFESPLCPALLVWIISCPALAARLCTPWIYDGDGWPGLTGIVCVCVPLCADESKGDPAVLLMRGHKVVYGRLHQCHGYGDKAIAGQYKSWRICVSLEVYVCTQIVMYFFKLRITFFVLL